MANKELIDWFKIGPDGVWVFRDLELAGGKRSEDRAMIYSEPYEGHTVTLTVDRPLELVRIRVEKRAADAGSAQLIVETSVPVSVLVNFVKRLWPPFGDPDLVLRKKDPV